MQSPGPASRRVPTRIYLPEHWALEVRGLGSRAKYTAACFDPVSGKRESLRRVQADDKGLWKCLPPTDHNHDSVLVLESP